MLTKIFRYFSGRRQKRYRLIPRVITQIWEFCQECAEFLCPGSGYRLIVTRIGRIGAGETREWAKVIPQKKERPKNIKEGAKRSHLVSGNEKSI